MLERLLKSAMGMSEPAYAGFRVQDAAHVPAARRAPRAFPDQPGLIEPSPGIEIALLTWSQMADQVDAWRDLFARALEPHVFMAPGFALHAAQHSAPAQRPIFLTITDSRPEKPRLIALLPFAPMPGPFGRVARLWRPSTMPVGTPLFDTDQAGEAMDALLGWFARHMPHVEALTMALVAQDGPTAVALRKAAAARGVFATGFESHERAWLMNDGEPEEILGAAISTARARRYRRQYRQLGELGLLSHAVATSTESCRDAFEEFLALEANGWKGKRGAALLRNAGLSTFARTMVRSLAQAGQCSIHSLRLDNRMIAACVVLQSGGYAYLWKMAYDEAYGDYSPGTLLMLDISRAHLADARIVATDSCTAPNNEMINRLWPHRVTFFDMMIATKPSGLGAGEAIARRETWRRVLRSRARDVYHRLFRR